MKKRTIAVILTLTLLITGLTFSLISVFSATYYQDADWKYEKPTANSQEYYIASYLGSSDMVRIPALFQGKPVTKIANNAFLNRTDITYVEVPVTINSIGMNAFYGCSSLENIVLPKTINEIGMNAFYGCNSLQSVDFSSDTQLKIIPANCFSGCSSITEVTISDGITTVSARAFLNCSSLSDVTIYPSVTSIGEKAFSGCNNMRILGWTNSYAETYAKENNIPFVSLGEYVPTTVTEPTVPTVPESSLDEPQPTVPASSFDEPQPTAPVTVPASSEVSTSTSISESSVATPVYYIGDSDLSGNITVKDATLIQKYAADLVILDRTQLFLSNCDSTGGVNVKDATQIQKYCADFKNILFVGDEVYF